MISSYIFNEILKYLKDIKNISEVSIKNSSEHITVKITIYNGMIFLIKYSMISETSISSVTENNIKGSVSVSETKDKNNLSDLISLVKLSFDPIFEITDNIKNEN